MLYSLWETERRCPYFTPEEYKNETITVHFGFVFEKTGAGKSPDYHDAIGFEKLRFRNDSHPHENQKSALSNSYGLKSFFEKPHFRDGMGLVWTVGLTVEIRLRVQISPA